VSEERTISKAEKTMINEIDSRLQEVNYKNQFSDTNLVQNNLAEISKKQKTKSSYISICFIILFLTLFSIRVCNESLITIAPYYMHVHFEKDLIFTSIFIFLSLMPVFPLAIYLKRLTLRNTKERVVLISSIGLAFLFSLFMIDILYTSIYSYCCFYILLIIVTNIIESLGSSLISKIIPADWELGTFNAGFIITVSTTAGRSIGAFMLTITGIFGNQFILLITYAFCSFLFLVIFILFVIYYSELRVKAIARILKSQQYRKAS
jgi:MFS family permease